MEELYFVYATAGLMLLYFLLQVVTRNFDPFAPVWLFLVGYLQVYVIQALSFHEWAVDVRGKELVAAANFRSFWALLWFLFIYQLGLGRKAAGILPRPPRGWSPLMVVILSPALIVWGLFCANMLAQVDTSGTVILSGEETLFRSFPFVMMVASVMLIVAGRQIDSPRPGFLAAGLLTAALYIGIWMFNGKRSPSLMGLLATICAFYLTRLKRPSWPVLISTALAGSLIVAIAIGWRETRNYQRSLAGFVQYVGDFQPQKVLVSLNVASDDEAAEIVSHETNEYGGFLLMMDTVPKKSGFDYGQSYLRVFSTFIPRIIWPNKPLFGRDKWISAWMAGSEMERAEDFAGPAIGILGATQLNGDSTGTLIVLACVALLLRTSYEYLRLHADAPWVQFWWSITYFNAWFMVVNDDPLVWFYYNWGFTALPVAAIAWGCNRGRAPAAPLVGASVQGSHP